MKFKKGYNSHHNCWILPLIELNLYFMIIYLCIEYESNKPIFSKDIERKPFFEVEKKGHNSHHIGGFYPKSNLTYLLLIIYLFIKSKSYTLIFLKNIERKPFFEVEKRAIALVIIDGFYP